MVGERSPLLHNPRMQILIYTSNRAQTSSYLNQNNSYVTKMCNKIKGARSELSKDVEIDDNILRQILFLFNLELWYQIFIESDNVTKPDLSLNRFV